MRIAKRVYRTIVDIIIYNKPHSNDTYSTLRTILYYGGIVRQPQPKYRKSPQFSLTFGIQIVGSVCVRASINYYIRKIVLLYIYPA